MFHWLHRLLVLIGWTLVGAALFYLYQKRQALTPAMDLVAAWRIQEGFQQSLLGEVRGRVVGVSSGDTFQLIDSAGLRHQIRLTGLTAPDFLSSNKAERLVAMESRTNLSNLILSNDLRVMMTYTNQPRNGLGLAFLGDTNVNAALITSGHVDARHDYMNGLPLRERYFLLRAERTARERVASSKSGSTDPSAR